MSWHPIELNGRRVVVVLCDNRIPADSPRGVIVTCHAETTVPARQVDENAERIQRVLVDRGWSWGNVDDGGKDYCPACTQAREAVAS